MKRRKAHPLNNLIPFRYLPSAHPNDQFCPAVDVKELSDALHANRYRQPHSHPWQPSNPPALHILPALCPLLSSCHSDPVSCCPLLSDCCPLLSGCHSDLLSCCPAAAPCCPAAVPCCPTCYPRTIPSNNAPLAYCRCLLLQATA